MPCIYSGTQSVSLGIEALLSCLSCQNLQLGSFFRTPYFAYCQTSGSSSFCLKNFSTGDFIKVGSRSGKKRTDRATLCILLHIFYRCLESLGRWSLSPLPSWQFIAGPHRDSCCPFRLALTHIGGFEMPVNLMCMSLDCRRTPWAWTEARRSRKLHLERNWAASRGNRTQDLLALRLQCHSQSQCLSSVLPIQPIQMHFWFWWMIVSNAVVWYIMNSNLRRQSVVHSKSSCAGSDPTGLWWMTKSNIFQAILSLKSAFLLKLTFFLLLYHHKGQMCWLHLAPPTVCLLDAKGNNANDKPLTLHHSKGIVKVLCCSQLTANNGTNNWFIPEWQRQYWRIILSRRSVGSGNLGTSSQAGLELT